FKLLRTWDIIDWCQQDPFTGQFPTWHCHQVVKISNNVKPEIETCDSISVCTYDSDCVDGYVELFAKGSDDCTENENLRWNYRVYTGASGVGPLSLTGTPYAEYSGVGDSINASGTYPIGSHIIQWTLYDKCGNATTCNQSFTVMNCKAATAYCISGLAVDLMPMDVDNDGTVDFGMVELWASDFDAGSSHPCQLPVHLSFSPDTSERNRIFDCTTRGDVDVEIWASVVGPDGNLIQSYCETYINVQDNMNACVGQSDVKVDVDGVILTEDLTQVDNISVDLDGSELSTTTDINGIYAFPEMPSGGDYVINPFSNDSPLNGVSTLDIIEIQKHILGIEQLRSPYKMIAADINNDNQITTIDLIELRKVILGVHPEFQSNDSWRFVDKGYIFTDPQNPLVESFTEDYEILGLNSDMNVDFIAVKVGDVNNTAQVSASNPVTQNRNSENMELYYEAIPITDGDIVSIPVYTNTEGVNGYQFTMNFDSDILEVLQVNGITADLTEHNYRIIDNNIVFSWNNTQVLNKGEAVFEIVARAKSSTTIHNVLDINSDVINAEAYAGNKMLNTVITDNISSENLVEDEFSLYQNSPNPFTNLTRVSFNLPQDSYVIVNVHDVQGQLLRQYSGDYTKGMNQIEINAEDLGLSGVMYLTIQTEQNTASIKMVVLK
ncbi:MAG: T9SS type A sorting domain-containing protein, partial [Bacteroidia bacterium]|nr:T9SS type A sorting domain-containing protein [Bacteroidia bacterium]